ncbi:MAG: hypothetical protein CMJ32_07705 [Phycisphaerae bacterium]|nr:hypothetical protein [Phycisphaerae bacterium]
MNFSLDNPAAFNWIWILLPLAAVVAWSFRRRIRAAAIFADTALFRRISPSFSLTRPVVRSSLVMVALAAIVISLMDVRWGRTEEEVEQRGIECFFVVDVSRSMLAGDAKPDRLERARQFIDDAVSQMTGDRVGLIDFAGTATVRTPLTVNYPAVRTAVEELHPREARRGGSMLGDAIRLASESFLDDDGTGKVIVVLTDGEDMESFPVEAAAKAWNDKGIRTFTVGIGSSGDGARIPTVANGQRAWVTHQGEVVWSKMDPVLLEKVALAGEGAFIPAGTRAVDMGAVFKTTIADVEQMEFEKRNVAQATPRFQWFVAIALFLLVLECLFSDRRPARTGGGVPA